MRWVCRKKFTIKCLVIIDANLLKFTIILNKLKSKRYELNIFIDSLFFENQSAKNDFFLMIVTALLSLSTLFIFFNIHVEIDKQQSSTVQNKIIVSLVVIGKMQVPMWPATINVTIWTILATEVIKQYVNDVLKYFFSYAATMQQIGITSVTT